MRDFDQFIKAQNWWNAIIIMQVNLSCENITKEVSRFSDIFKPPQEPHSLTNVAINDPDGQVQIILEILKDV